MYRGVFRLITNLEQRIADKIKDSLGGNTLVSVIDVSGGCGAMLNIDVGSSQF